jgi:hypothetical protein
MDPYLESPTMWPDFHNSLVVAIRDCLVPLLLPRYHAALEQRIYAFTVEDLVQIGVPDVAIFRKPKEKWTAPREHVNPDASPALEVLVPVSTEVKEIFLEIRESSSKEVVTVVELLSPANKLHGKGRADYLEKRNTVLRSRVNLVEVDLLRAGAPMPLQSRVISTDYRILVCGAHEHPRARLHAFDLRNSLPSFSLPLLQGDAELAIDLSGIFDAVYGRARYDLLVDYSRPPLPAIAARDAAWARSLLKAAGKLPRSHASPRVGARTRGGNAAPGARKKAQRS